MKKMAPRYPTSDSLSVLPEPFRNLDLGPVLFKNKNAPRPPTLLADKYFETSLYDANLVGNLYFSNYSMWLAKLREAYFFSLAPALFRGVGEAGVFKCASCNIEHLREGMPFDTIYVTMYLKSLYRAGVDLYFEFFKLESDGQKTKLAFGEHRAVWMQRDNNGRSMPTPLPEPFTAALLQSAAASALTEA